MRWQRTSKMATVWIVEAWLPSSLELYSAQSKVTLNVIVTFR
jgi:hypothetical protein